MIRHHQVDVAVAEATPQALAVCGVTDRWCTLEFGVRVWDLIGAQAKVVMARFDGELGAVLASRADAGDGVGGRQVHDVGANAVNKGDVSFNTVTLYYIFNGQLFNGFFVLYYKTNSNLLIFHCHVGDQFDSLQFHASRSRLQITLVLLWLALIRRRLIMRADLRVKLCVPK